MAHTDNTMAALSVKLDIAERVRAALPETTVTREAETNTKIVALLKAGHGELKHYTKDSEQHRVQILFDLSLVMPPPCSWEHAMITRVSGFTTASKLLWSSGGSTEQKKMPRVSLLRSGTRHMTQMPRSHR